METQADVPPYRERLAAFIAKVPELQAKDTLQMYYIESFGPATPPDIIAEVHQFWQEVLEGYLSKVVGQFTVDVTAAKRDFTLFSKIPALIPTVINERMKEQWRPLSELKVIDQGNDAVQLAEGSSVFSMIGKTLYDNTLGLLQSPQEEPLSTLFYNAKLMKELAQKLQRKIDEDRLKSGDLLSMAAYRRLTETIVKEAIFVDVQNNIDLFSIYLRKNGLLASGRLCWSDSRFEEVVKVAPIGSKLESDQISSEEKAPLQIKILLSQIEREIDKKMLESSQMKAQIKQNLATNNKETALKILRMKKNVDSFVAGLQDKQVVLQQTLLGIETAESNHHVFEALKQAEKAGQNSLPAEKVKDLMSSLDDQAQERNLINEFFSDSTSASLSLESDTLEQELDDLLKQAEEPEPKKEAKSLDEEVAEVEEWLKELQVGSGQIGQGSTAAAGKKAVAA